MNWAIKRLRPYRYWLMLAVLTAVFFGCLTKQEPDTFSLPEKFVDSLSRYDSVKIILKDASGKTLDLLFHGKVVSAEQLRNLPAPHALDGEMLVTIIGYQGGQVTYLVDRVFNGVTHQVEGHLPIILPTSKVSFGVLELRIPKKTTVPLPIVTVEPAELADKSLLWASSNTMVFEIGPKGLWGVATGTANLRVSLKFDTAKYADISITVVPNTKLPDSLKISPDTLKVAAMGRAGQFALQAFPATAGAVTWHIEDSTVASITGDGQVKGLKRGAVKVSVVSKEDESISDSALVAVSDPISVESVRFLKNKLDLFVEGAAESLLVDVQPAESNPEVGFSMRDSSIVRIVNGRILGLRVGVTYVISKSLENPLKTDSLQVTVFPSQRVDSIRVIPDTLKLFVGGEPKTLQAKLYPATLTPLVQWTSASPAIATVDSTGKVSPGTEGKAFVTAISKSDSGKKAASLILVKRDVPILDVGRDTTIPVGGTVIFRPKVSQEYGTVNRFKWDLNGDGAWDDSAAELKSITYKYDLEKEVAALFYVRDSEGNDTSVVKRVKVVNGPAINIFSPLNNSYSNKSPIPVEWSVNGKDQEVFLKEILKEGANTVTRTAKDSLGNVYSASITVYYDTTSPNKPLVKGPATTGSPTPAWTWTSGGKGGAGVYRFSLDKDEFTGVSENADTAYTPDVALKEEVHTLYVQERDAAGNWSPSGRFAIRVDLLGPETPIVKVSPAGITNVRKPVWSWGRGEGGTGSFQFKLDNADLKTGATATMDTSYSPKANLTNGSHTLYVQEKDSLGNWSVSGFATVVIDTIGPNAPTVTSTSPSPTNNPMPTWNWISGGNGGKGLYRYKLGDTVWASGGVQGTATTFTPTSAAEGTRVLYVAEQDSAGNWSSAGSKTIQIDLTPPEAPKMDLTPYSPLNSLRPNWTWKTGGGGGGVYRYKMDNGNMTSGAVETGTPSFAPESNIPEGPHTLYVQEQDAVGNWSLSASKTVFLSPSGIVGGGTFSSGPVGDYSMAINSLGEKFVVYQQSSGPEIPTVLMRNTGTSWVSLGDPSKFGTVRWKYGLALGGPTGIPYLALQDSGNKASVIRYTNGKWETVGNSPISTGDAGEIAIAINPSGIPLVVFRDAANGDKTTVMYLNGNTWKNLGKSGFSIGFSIYFTMAMNSSGVPYIAYLDAGYDPAKVIVQKLNPGDSTWVPVGSLEIHSQSNGPISLVISKKDSVFLALESKDNGGDGMVLKFNGSSWDFVGGSVFQAGDGSQISIAVDSSGNKFVAYRDLANGNRITVKTLRGAKWELVGLQAFSQPTDGVGPIFLNPEGVPFVPYTDAINGGKISVIRTAFEP